MPSELYRYLYRHEFGLTAEEMDNEPAHEFFLNMQIYAWIKKKQELEAKHG